MAALAWSAPLRADSEPNPIGAVGVFAAFLAAAAAATPYFILSDGKDPGYRSLGMAVGAGGHLDAVAVQSDFGGYMRRGGFFGWMGRARAELSNRGENFALRIDSDALLLLAGDPLGPLSLEGIGGLTIWPRVVTPDVGKVHAYAAVGPTAGLRLRAGSDIGWARGELEVDYAALFGSAPTGQLHHLEFGPVLDLAPWPHPSGIGAIELRARWEIGLGGEDAARTAGVVILAGMRLQLGMVGRKR